MKCRFLQHGNSNRVAVNLIFVRERRLLKPLIRQMFVFGKFRRNWEVRVCTGFHKNPDLRSTTGLYCSSMEVWIAIFRPRKIVLSSLWVKDCLCPQLKEEYQHQSFFNISSLITKGRRDITSPASTLYIVLESSRAV